MTTLNQGSRMVAKEPSQGDWPVRREEFGSLLRAHRRQRGLSQGQLGDAVGHDYTYISKLETGSQSPADPDEVLRLAVALRLTSTEADELLRALPRFASVRFRTDVAPFSPADDRQEATWLNLLTRLMRVYAIEREETADAIAAHVTAFATVPALLVFILDSANRPHRQRLKRLLVELAARDVRTSTLMVLRDVVLLPAEVDEYQRKRHHLYLSLLVVLVKLDAPKVDLSFRDAYSAALTRSQRDALRLFRQVVERRIPGHLTIELPAL